MMNINLIAERRARKIREMTILRISTLIVVGLTAIMVLWNMYEGVLHLSAKNRLAIISDELEKQRPRYEEWQKISNEISQRQPVVDLLEEVQKSEGAWMIILSDLGMITPREVTVANLNAAFTEEGMSLHLAARARDEKTVAVFMEAFRERTAWAGTPVLKNVSSERKSPGNTSVRFDLTIPVKGLTGGDF